VMKPTGAFGTGVAQTKGRIVCCIQDAIMWITICSLSNKVCDSGKDEAARNRKGWVAAVVLECDVGVRLCDARLVYEERLKPEAKGTEPSFLVVDRLIGDYSAVDPGICTVMRQKVGEHERSSVCWLGSRSTTTTVHSISATARSCALCSQLLRAWPADVVWTVGIRCGDLRFCRDGKAIR
jgi:hypothetical protein